MTTKMGRKQRIANMLFSTKSLMLLLNVIILKAVLPAAAQGLNGISVVMGSKQYYIDPMEKGSFYQGVNFCAQYDMKLASIENKDEYNRLFSILKSNEILDNAYWLSGNSYGLGDVLTWWGTGKPVSYWGGGNTLNPTTDPNNCLSTVVNTFAYAAKDCVNDNTFSFICEKPLEPNCGKYGQCRYTYSYSTN